MTTKSKPEANTTSAVAPQPTGEADSTPSSFSEPGDEGVVRAIASLDGWLFAWSRAIARHWGDDPDGTFTKELCANPRRTMYKYFKFEWPSRFQLEIQQYTGQERWDPAMWERGVNGWTDVQAFGSKIVMVLPPAPEVEHRAAALADYQAAGRGYPFSTCCC